MSPFHFFLLLFVAAEPNLLLLFSPTYPRDLFYPPPFLRPTYSQFTPDLLFFTGPVSLAIQLSTPPIYYPNQARLPVTPSAYSSFLPSHSFPPPRPTRLLWLIYPPSFSQLIFLPLR